MRPPTILLCCCALVACRATRDADTAAGATVGATSRSPAPAAMDSSEVGLTLDSITYTRGATVGMRISSRSRDVLGYNPCSSRVVERQAGSAWSAHPEPDRMCTMELRLLGRGETQNATTTLPRDLEPGNYRIVLTLSRQESQAVNPVRAISPTFSVKY